MMEGRRWGIWGKETREKEAPQTKFAQGSQVPRRTTAAGIRGRGIMLLSMPPGRPAIVTVFRPSLCCQLTPVSRDTISM